MARSAQTWIEHLGLQQHIEGGWYREVYRSALSFQDDHLSASFDGPRSACTHIYFLLEQGNFSAFHRIRSDELWHFYDGDPIIVYEINETGGLEEHLLGSDPNKSQSPFCIIRAGSWFASRVAGDGDYGLVGCSVSPGFDFTDFELATRSDLTRQFPQHVELIQALCRI